jgi:hypothetical protein
MFLFERVESNGDLKEIIESVFDLSLSVEGGWGYSRESATVIKKTDLPIAQLEHTIASMRTHLEMNITRSKEERYGSINLNEIDRKEFHDGLEVYHQITYAITAMKEEQYNVFVEEYKKGYGEKDFNISEHFEKRKKATLDRTEIYWFRIPPQID